MSVPVLGRRTADAHGQRCGEKMTILVDEARWPWRGTMWCHLVSNDNFAELHAFAAGLGQRRVGFQGDHYDIDVDTRELALANGAIPTGSREIVAQMKAAGLRRRRSTFIKWQLASRSNAEDADPQHITKDLVLAQYLDHGDGWFQLTRRRLDGSLAEAVVIFGERSPDLALPAEDPGQGLFVRVDLDDNYSIERITPPPTDRE